MPDGKRKRRHSSNQLKRQWYAEHRSHSIFGFIARRVGRLAYALMSNQRAYSTFAMLWAATA